MDLTSKDSEKSTDSLLKASRKKRESPLVTARNYRTMLKSFTNKENTKVSFGSVFCSYFFFLDSEKLLFSLKEILVNESS